MSRIRADVNVPEEYVSALRGDGHDVEYSWEIAALGPEATDDAIAAQGLTAYRRAIDGAW